ncbi:MAG: 4-(cytidine 5'-diphospho)-2-C-methyl-D-erythritol kinase [Deltaproteobacteria bacterium]|nr:4-(cytidine 5'-diphospho)-2-C-methyl-D-erythritol kinase [Deltaproteobacteria bacterium]
MTRAELRAPAKLNLGLRITGRRADGYHELESLFVPIALADTLRVELSGAPGVRLRVSGDAAVGVPEDTRNLAWRAAEAFAREAKLGTGVSLALEKRVPSPAGLGGGSSDAGAVLRALSRLTGSPVAPPRLAEIALALGADVPFFLDPRPALVEGIGERVLPVSGVPELPVLLAHPGFGLETRAVYAAFDAQSSLTAQNHPLTLRALLALGEEAGAVEARFPSDDARLRELVANDLEPAATRLRPEVAKLREELSRTGARAVGMSGSGPTLYAIYASEAAARIAEPQVAATGARTWLTRTLTSGTEQLEPRERDRASE